MGTQRDLEPKPARRVTARLGIDLSVRIFGRMLSPLRGFEIIARHLPRAADYLALGYALSPLRG